MNRARPILLAASLALLLGVDAPRAQVRLPHVFGSHMVLQRDRPLPVWGWAEPGARVAVALDGHEVQVDADTDGAWRVELPARPAGGPHRLVVRGPNEIVLEDVLVGEVWLCSGQSNMEMGVGVAADGEAEIAAADHPGIRLFELPRNPAGEPRADVPASWLVCRPDAISAGDWGGFSAAGYYFGRELHRELDVPIGLIDSCWGGTRIEPWTPRCGFEAAGLGDFVTEIDHAGRRYRETLPVRLAEIEGWIGATRAAIGAGELLPPSPRWPQHPLESSGRPTGLYNGMIHPLVPFALRGVIWYQGESNVHSHDRMTYRDKMVALVGGWREVWGQGDFPFLYVQIAPFKYEWHAPGIDPEEVPRIWEAQAAALSIPNTGMVVTTDIADLRDIHPANKQEVGRRLALWALAKTYGRDGLVHSGPLYRSMAVEGAAIRVSFDHVGGGLAARDGRPLSWFQIAGADRVFVDAEARIEGGEIVASSPDIAVPVAVRFGWHMEAVPNLMNREGLPASPFRTDDW